MQILTGIITTVWALNFAAQLAAQFTTLNYDPDPSINGIFAVVVGALYGLNQWQQPRRTCKKTTSDPHQKNNT